MKKLFLFVLAIPVIFISCRKVFGKKVKGSGTITTTTRAVSGYTSVDVSSSLDVYVIQDSLHSVKIETDDNLAEYIDIKEEGGVLYISMRKNYNLKPTKDIKIFVSGPVFRKFEASGACDFYTQGLVTSTESIAIELSGSSDAEMQLNAPRISADLTGAGSIKLSGQTKDLELDGTGSSTLKCLEMMAENVDVDITGAGDAEVFASVKLDVSVTGSGSVKYKGSPAVNQNISGAGSVKQIQ